MFQVVQTIDSCDLNPANAPAPVYASGGGSVSVGLVEQFKNLNPYLKLLVAGVGILIIVQIVKKQR